MLKLLRRAWKYVAASLSMSFNENADPKVQLEQAISEAHDSHRRLRDQAATVIAGQKQAEMRLNAAAQQVDKLAANARQAVMMADQEAKAGNEEKAADYTSAAESFATRLIAAEEEVDALKALVVQSTQAAQQAKNAVQQNAVQLQKKLSERQRLLGQLDQARMQEQVNKAMASLSETVGAAVPSLDEVRAKIEARHAHALGTAELTGSGVDSRILQVEKAAQDAEAQARLAAIRSELGIAPAAEAPDVSSEPTPDGEEQSATGQ